MRILSIAAAALAGTAFATMAHAQATIDIQQQGANVVATLSGSIDTAGLTYFGTTQESGDGLTGATGQVLFNGNGQAGDAYFGVSGPQSFGSGVNVAFSTESGDEFLWDSANLILPEGYLPDTSLSAIGIFDDTTIAGLGLTPGTYVYSWNPGTSDGNFVVTIGQSVPEPASLPLLAAGVAALAALARAEATFRAKRRTPQPHL